MVKQAVTLCDTFGGAEICLPSGGIIEIIDCDSQSALGSRLAIYLACCSLKGDSRLALITAPPIFHQTYEINKPGLLMFSSGQFDAILKATHCLKQPGIGAIVIDDLNLLTGKHKTENICFQMANEAAKARKCVFLIQKSANKDAQFYTAYAAVKISSSPNNLTKKGRFQYVVKSPFLSQMSDSNFFAQ